MDKKVIGWQVGKNNWAFGNMASHVEGATPEYLHVRNVPGDIDILVVPDQLKYRKHDKTTIMHIDGNRWYEK